jgi:hypothetical protein
MREVTFRCSSVGKLMGDPKKKGEVLSQTAKSYVRGLVAQEIFSIEFEISSKQMEKGVECEDASIALFNRVYGRALTKNTDRRTDEYLSGESDMLDVDEVVDIKTAWSVATFPLSEDDIADTQRKLYEFQLRAYMRLWDKPRARLAYCLVDTPERLIGYEPIQLHAVSHIPENLRVTTWAVTRDAAIEADMIEKIKAARVYYAEVIAEFDRTHKIGGMAPEAVVMAAVRAAADDPFRPLIAPSTVATAAPTPTKEAKPIMPPVAPKANF